MLEMNPIDDSSSSNETDLLSFDDISTSSIMSLSLQQTVESLQTDATTTVGNTGKKNLSLINVQVSGVAYSVPREAFQQLLILPWVQVPAGDCSKRNSYTSAISDAAVYHLSTSPDIFEVLLNHILYKNLPEYESLCKNDVEELLPMAIILKLDNLVAFFEKQNDVKKLRSQLRQTFSMKKAKTKAPAPPPNMLNENKNLLNIKKPTLSCRCSALLANFRRKRSAVGVGDNNNNNLRRKSLNHQHANACMNSIHIN